MNFICVNSTARSKLWINILRKSINIKNPGLSGSRIVDEAFLQSLSIYYLLLNERIDLIALKCIYFGMEA